MSHARARTLAAKYKNTKAKLTPYQLWSNETGQPKDEDAVERRNRWNRMTTRQQNTWDTLCDHVAVELKDIWRLEKAAADDERARQRSLKLRDEWIITDHGYDYDGRLMGLEFQVYRQPTEERAHAFAKRLIYQHRGENGTYDDDDDEDKYVRNLPTSDTYTQQNGCMAHTISVKKCTGSYIGSCEYMHS